MAEQNDLVSKSQVEVYYNTFKEHQKKLGVNIRHRTIFKNLENLDLKPGSNVLLAYYSNRPCRYTHH